MKKRMLIKIMLIQMVMVILSLRLEPEHIEFLSLVISSHPGMGRRVQLV